MPERYAKVVESKDNVATLLRDVEEGETLELAVDDDTVSVTLTENVTFGHKVAIQRIPKDETIYKYGKSIGYASEDIEPGEWVHVHNVESNYGRGDLAAEDDANAQAIHE
jgi:altronate dehydratase small subunit